MRVEIFITDDDGEVFGGEVELKPKKATVKPKTKVRVEKHVKKPPNSLPKRILELKEDDFFKNPKSAIEVKKELKIRTFHHTDGQIRVALMRMARDRKHLRRLGVKEGKDKIYKYVNL